METDVPLKRKPHRAKNRKVHRGSLDMNPDEEFENVQTVESMFVEEKYCKIMFSLGVRIFDISKEKCMKFCQENDNCKSVSYKDANGGDHNTCLLNTETKYEVGLFYASRTEISQKWNHYQQVKDYFLIFYKESGTIIKAKDKSSIDLTEKEGEDCFWFWTGLSIRSKKYPDKVLTASSEDAGLSQRPVVLRNYKVDLLQKWRYTENKIKLELDGASIKLALSIGANKAIIATPMTKENSNYWSLSLDRSYFIITSRGSGTVLDAAFDPEGVVHLWDYHGKDNQLWFWDDEHIRSKHYPDKVLQVNGPLERVSLGTYVFGDEKQLWTVDDNGIMKTVAGTSICASDFINRNGIVIEVCENNQYQNAKWSFSSARLYFFILQKSSGNVISAKTDTTLHLQKYDMNSKQLWYWDGHIIRNKMYTNKILTVNKGDNNKVHLAKFVGDDTQHWVQIDNYLHSNNNASRNKKLEYRGTFFVVSDTSTEEWGITISHDFFTIWNKHYGTVLDVITGFDVITWNYHGLDHQQWFWDGRNLRSKKYPEKVLDMKLNGADHKDSVQVYVAEYDGGLSQNWRHFSGEFISDCESRKLTLKNFVSRETRQRVTACGICNSDENVKWAFSSKNITYFGIQDVVNESRIMAFDDNNDGKVKSTL